MISKRRLLRLVKKALETEEQIIPIYANHCRLFSDCLELDGAVRERFIEVFNFVITLVLQRHLGLLEVQQPHYQYQKYGFCGLKSLTGVVVLGR